LHFGRTCIAVADGLSPLVADLLVGLDQLFRESVLGETTMTFEELTGKPSRTQPQWLAENIESFRSQTETPARDAQARANRNRK